MRKFAADLIALWAQLLLITAAHNDLAAEKVPTSSESSKKDVEKKKSTVGNLYDAFVCIRKLSNAEQARGLGGVLQPVGSAQGSQFRTAEHRGLLCPSKGRCVWTLRPVRTQEGDASKTGLQTGYRITSPGRKCTTSTRV